MSERWDCQGKHEWDSPDEPDTYCQNCGGSKLDLDRIEELEVRLETATEIIQEAHDGGVKDDRPEMWGRIFEFLKGE